jgi:putative tricarboxylic transport membrane protein
MKRKVLAPLCALIAVFSCITLASEARSAEYPDKTIEFVVHSGPGGGADTFLRMIGNLLNTEGLVKPKIQVTNRPGGSATVAVNYVASKKGDPNFLLGWTTAPLIAILRGTTTVKAVTDMTLLSAMAVDPGVLAVRADSKYKTLKDLTDDAKKNPDKIRAGIDSAGGSAHVAVNRLEKAAGVKFNITAFTTASTVALLGGHIDFVMETAPQLAQHVAAGKLRALAAFGSKRTSFAPEVPTLMEQGVNAAFTQFRGFWGPPEMPDYAMKFWGQTFAKLSEKKEFKDMLEKIGMDPVYMGPEQMKQFMPGYIKDFAADLKDLEVYGGKKN